MLRDISNYPHKDLIEQISLEEAITFMDMELPVKWDLINQCWNLEYLGVYDCAITAFHDVDPKEIIEDYMKHSNLIFYFLK